MGFQWIALTTYARTTHTHMRYESLFFYEIVCFRNLYSRAGIGWFVELFI